MWYIKWDNIHQFANNNISIISWFMMCNLPIILVNIGFYATTPWVILQEIIKPLLHLFSSFFIATILVTIIAWLSKYIIGKIIKYICVFLVGVIFVADLYTYIMFSSIVNQSVLEIVMTVNTHIAVDYFRNYFSWWLIPKLIFCGFIIYILYIVIRFGVQHLVKSKIAVATLVAIFGLSFLIMFVHRSEGAVRDFSLSRLVINLYNAYDSVGNEDKVVKAMKKAIPNEIVSVDDETHVILVLGESVDRNHMEMYGYGVPNTPYISNRINKGEVFVFDDVISPANGTSKSMQLMFTYAQKGDEIWYNNANIFDIAKKAGYELTWLSNQNMSGLTGSMDKIYSDLCDKKEFTILGDSNESIPHDEELLSIIDNNNLHGNRKFSVIHLKGSHEPYYQRYPKAFNMFAQDGYDYPSEKGRVTKAEYDNSILYTDYILNEIIKKFEDENVILIYTSDHGAEVYDNREFCGHSLEEQGNRHMIEVPMFIWVSEKYRNSHKDMLDKIKISTRRPFMNDDFIYVLTDVLGINIPDKNSKHSLLSWEYEPSHERYYNGKLYEK